MVGINQTMMMTLAMVVIGLMIGAKGLEMEVLLAINRIEVGPVFEQIFFKSNMFPLAF